MTYKILSDTETQIKYVSYTLNGVEYKISPVSDNGVLRHLTEEEAKEKATKEAEWNNTASSRKLAEIKQIRLQKLQETDWWVLRGTMTDAQKDFRQNLRDIPANHTNENAYDLLLARNDAGELTHSIWSKP